MLVERQTSKVKQTVMIVLILVTNIVVGIMLYQNFFPKKRTRQTVPVVEFMSPQLTGQLSNIGAPAEHFDVSITASADFASLKKYGNWPVQFGTLGKPDPFIPVFGE